MSTHSVYRHTAHIHTAHTNTRTRTPTNPLFRTYTHTLPAPPTHTPSLPHLRIHPPCPIYAYTLPAPPTHTPFLPHLRMHTNTSAHQHTPKHMRAQKRAYLACIIIINSSFPKTQKSTHTHTCVHCWLMCSNKGQMLWHLHMSTIWSENVQQLISSYVWWWHGFAERRHVRVISATTLTARSTQHAENTYTRRISIKSLSRLTLACPHNPQIIRLDECAQLHS